jgi:hypothetical protein
VSLATNAIFGLDINLVAIIVSLCLVACGVAMLLPLEMRTKNSAGTMAPAAPRAIAAATPEAPLSADEQWCRISSVIGAASEKADHIHRLQKSAASQLDSANYALQEMMLDLEAVLPGLSKAVRPSALRVETPRVLTRGDRSLAA